MKKITLLILMLVGSVSTSFGQFTEGFETGIPPTWTVINGGDVNTWVQFTNPIFVLEGTASATISFSSDAHDDYLITPAIEVVAGVNDRFSFWARSFDPLYPEEFELLISTTTPDAAGLIDFVDIIAPDSSLSTYTEYTYDLSAYVGQTIYIGMHSTTADMWRISVDHIVNDTAPTTVPDCAANAVSTPDATCGNFATTLSWDAVAGVTGYILTVGTTTGGTDVLNAVNIGNVVSYVLPTQLIGTPYFWTVVPVNGVGPATGCTENTYTTAATGCYCTSEPVSFDNDGITNVIVGTTNFPTNPVSYFDHTATVADLTQGISNNIQISFATGYDYNTYVLIDFNDDFDFDDAGEVVYTGVSSADNPTTLDASFIMSATAALGEHRMRIVTADVMPTLNPCYSGTYGVTLDFTVNILPAPACIPPTALTATNITAISADLGWTENGTATSWDIEWGTLGFTATGTPNIPAATNTQNLPGLSPNTAYSFYVRANCGGSESNWSGPFTFTTTCVAANVPFSQDFESATVPALPNCSSQQNVGTGNLWTVENATNAYGFTGKYLRYRWNTTNAANTWFFTQGINLTGGTAYSISYDYGATGLYPENLKVAYGSSNSAAAMTNVLADYPDLNIGTPSNEIVEFTPATTGVYYFGFNAYSTADQFYLYVDNIAVDVALANNSFDNSNFSYYPNPVKNILNLSYNQNISQVEVFNLLGQKMASNSFDATTAQVDMTSYTSGIYLVNVTSNNTTKTIRVIKE